MKWGDARMDRQLARKTTLDECGISWGTGTWTGQARKRWMVFRAEVEAALVDDAELWEWESSGLRHFAGTYGVAVVRAGEVIKSWEIGRS